MPGMFDDGKPQFAIEDGHVVHFGISDVKIGQVREDGSVDLDTLKALPSPTTLEFLPKEIDLGDQVIHFDPGELSFSFTVSLPSEFGALWYLLSKKRKLKHTRYERHYEAWKRSRKR